MQSALMSNYKRLPIEFERGSGAWLIDTKGNRYLDAISGIAVCGLGHSHPKIQQAISAQAAKLIHTSNLYHIPLQEKLAKKLVQYSGMDAVFFGNSGAEANEAAIKLARLYASNKAVKNPLIITTDNSFHGRTIATLTATGNPKVKEGFEPLLEGFMHIPYDDINALNETVKKHQNIVAIIVEPIIGEGGVIIPDDTYLKAIRDFCDQHDCLMIVDEIQTGMCRTGKWFAFQHANIKPDIITLAKSLGNGVPIGACLASSKAANLFSFGSHGSTFGGNPLAAKVALTVIDILEDQSLDKRAAEVGKHILESLKICLHDIRGIKSIRGKGLMIGVELDREAPDLALYALEKGILINVTAGNVVRLLPPLIINDKEVEQIVSLLSDILKQYLARK